MMKVSYIRPYQLIYDIDKQQIRDVVVARKLISKASSASAWAAAPTLNTNSGAASASAQEHHKAPPSLINFVKDREPQEALQFILQASIDSLQNSHITNVREKIELLLNSLNEYGNLHPSETGGKRGGFKAWRDRDDFKQQLTLEGKKIFNDKDFTVDKNFMKELKKISASLQEKSRDILATKGKFYTEPSRKEVRNKTRSIHLARLYASSKDASNILK